MSPVFFVWTTLERMRGFPWYFLAAVFPLEARMRGDIQFSVLSERATRLFYPHRIGVVLNDSDDQ